MPQIKEISSRHPPNQIHNVYFRERGSCNGNGRLISLRYPSGYGPGNVVYGEVNGRTGQRTIIPKTFNEGETDVGCSLASNGDGINRQVNWAYGDTNYFPSNVDDPYDSIVIVQNPLTGSRYVWNLHARNATIVIRRAAGKEFQYAIGPSHSVCYGLNPGDAVTFAMWNAAIIDYDNISERSQKVEVLEIESEYSPLPDVSLRTGEEHPELGFEQVLTLSSSTAANVIVAITTKYRQGSDLLLPLTLEPGEYVLGYTKDKEGDEIKYAVAWALNDPRYFPPSSIWDGRQAFVVTNNPKTGDRFLWNPRGATMGIVVYWSEVEQRELSQTIWGLNFHIMKEGDFIRELYFQP